MVFNTKLPDGFYDYLVTFPENQNEALQQEIQKKFGIIGRHEIRLTKLYQIKVEAKTGSGLKIAQPGSYEILDSTNGIIKGPLFQLWYTLECYLHTPVMADDDLGYKYDVEFKCEEFKHEASPQSKVDVNNINDAMLDQLGLELVPTNMPIEMLIVEKAP